MIHIPYSLHKTSFYKSEISRELYIKSNSEKGEGDRGGKENPTSLPSQPRAPEVSGEGDDITWQEAAVSFELFQATKALLWGMGTANKNFRGIVGSAGLPGPSKSAEGVTSP